MILPHALFLMVGIAIKVLFPSAVAWIATETYAIFILSQVYPWIWTVALLFQYRHATNDDGHAKTTETRTPLKESNQSNNHKITQRPFSRTTPKVKNNPSPAELSAAARRAENYSVEQDATYWWQFWTLYCLVTGISRVISLIPIVGRLLTRTTRFQTTASELCLLWYLWIYGMSSILTSTATSDADLQRTFMIRPLPFCTRRWKPIVQRIFRTTSNIISQETWTMLVDKVKSFLSIAVMIRLISEQSQTRLLQLLEYAHPFLVPAISLLMPGFVTEYGVLYVNTIVPSARDPRTELSLSQTMDSLQYWVLHILLSNLLQWWSGILWYIPFSTHCIFLAWCHLQYTSSTYYNILELELQAFGLLPKGKRQPHHADDPNGTIPTIDQTMTVTMFRKIAQSLPSAVTTANTPDEKDRHDKDDDNKDDDDQPDCTTHDNDMRDEKNKCNSAEVSNDTLVLPDNDDDDDNHLDDDHDDENYMDNENIASNSSSSRTNIAKSQSSRHRQEQLNSDITKENVVVGLRQRRSTRLEDKKTNKKSTATTTSK